MMEETNRLEGAAAMNTQLTVREKLEILEVARDICSRSIVNPKMIIEIYKDLIDLIQSYPNSDLKN